MNEGKARSIFSSFCSRDLSSVRDLFSDTQSLNNTEFLMKNTEKPIGFELTKHSMTFLFGEYEVNFEINSGKIISAAPRKTISKLEQQAYEVRIDFLPYSGRSFIFWGGDNPEDNNHFGIPEQHFAIDIIEVDEAGAACKGIGLECEDHFCFGKSIVAVDDGVVSTVIDGITDNAPGYSNEYNLTGNGVIIDHGKNLFSHYYHLKCHSTVVSVGSKVLKGDVISECGNSGQSTAPHLHFQFCDSQMLHMGSSVEFLVSVDGKFIRPSRGMVI